MSKSITWCWRCSIAVAAIVAVPFVFDGLIRSLEFDLKTIEWESMSALGSFAAAGVALWLGLRSIRAEERAAQILRAERLETASIYAGILDHELGVVYGMLQWSFKHLNSYGPNSDQVIARIEFERYVKKTSLPMLERFAEKLEVFPISAARSLGVLLSGIGTIRRSEVPQREIFEAMPQEIRELYFKNANRECATAIMSVFFAAAAIRRELPRGHRSGVILERVPEAVLQVWLSTIPAHDRERMLAGFRKADVAYRQSS
ncbi:MAG: hypothetical protein J0L88_02330 [Xanthomonadales bacterium]|nr:hypothetical protein [Xanthomonadales bacterium]